MEFIVFQVSIVDVTSKTKMFSLTGPLSSATLEGLGAAASGPNRVALMGFQGSPVVVAEGSGLAAPGYTLVVDEQAAGEVWRNLTLKVQASSPLTSIVCMHAQALMQLNCNCSCAMNTHAAGDLCKRLTVISETRHSAPNVFCTFALYEDLCCDRLAGHAYGAVIDEGIADMVQTYIMLHARSACSLTYLNNHSSCRFVPVSYKFFVHTQKACKVLLGSV
jgi:hypothetical protein